MTSFLIQVRVERSEWLTCNTVFHTQSGCMEALYRLNGAKGDLGIEYRAIIQA